MSLVSCVKHHLLVSGYNRCICTIHFPAPPLFPSHIVWAHVKLAQISLFDHTVPAPQQRTMTDQDCAKRRKVAQTSLTVNLFVPDKEAHRVDNGKFREWNKKVVKILEDAEKLIEVVSAKFVKTSGAQGMQAPCEPKNWTQLRHDQNTQ